VVHAFPQAFEGLGVSERWKKQFKWCVAAAADKASLEPS
jgi:hypothetical protein